MSKNDWLNVNTVDDLDSYDDITTYLQSKRNETRNKHLLLGNGFSVAYDPSIFSYIALSNFVETSKDKLLTNLFQAINSKNFEEVMRHLDVFLVFAKSLNANASFIKTITTAHDKLKKSLIQAVEALHPKHVYKIAEEKSQSCAAFFNYYLSKGTNLLSLYIGVYSDEDLSYVKSIKDQYKIPLRVYNAKTVNAW